MFWRNPKKPEYNKLTYFHGRRFSRLPRTFAARMNADQVDSRSTTGLITQEVSDTADDTAIIVDGGADDDANGNNYPDEEPILNSYEQPSELNANMDAEEDLQNEIDTDTKYPVATNNNAAAAESETECTVPGPDYDTTESKEVSEGTTERRQLSGQVNRVMDNERQPLISFDEILGALRNDEHDRGTVTFRTLPEGVPNYLRSVQYNPLNYNGFSNFGESTDPWTRDDPTYPRMPDGMAPPPYDAVFQGWRLTFKDFHPRCLTEGGVISRPTFERFE